MSLIYHVNAQTGKDYFDGSETSPFKTINKAASIAMPGDTVIVHDGVYREWVDPQNSGLNEQARITYMAAPGEHPVIKGSERITTWEHVEGNVWKVVLPNSFFGGFNPYKEVLEGDWFIFPDHTVAPHEVDGVLMDFPLHLGDVYLNGKSFYDCRDRSTPYHFPHSAELAGCTIVYGGDDRLYNNIFIGGSTAEADDASCGTAGYNGHPHGWETYQAIIRSKGNSDHEKFQETNQPVYISGNAYLNNAPAYEEETENYVTKNPCNFRIVEEEDGTYMELTVDLAVFDIKTAVVSTATLGSTRITEGLFEDKDGRPYVIDYDFFGKARSASPVAGPIESLKVGFNRIKVW